MENGRICTSCITWKTWSEFEKQKRNKTGHRTVCKTCQKLKSDIKTSVGKSKNIRGLKIELTLVSNKEAFLRALDYFTDLIFDEIYEEVLEKLKQEKQ